MREEPLTALAVRNAKPTDKLYRLSAGKGLVLQVMPTGAKYWRLRYEWAGKERMLALGVYPEVSLADAREARDQARKLIAAGVDPNTQRRADKMARQVAAENSLEAVARAWHTTHVDEWAPEYAERICARSKTTFSPGSESAQSTR